MQCYSHKHTLFKDECWSQKTFHVVVLRDILIKLYRRALLKSIWTTFHSQTKDHEIKPNKRNSFRGVFFHSKNNDYNLSAYKTIHCNPKKKKWISHFAMTYIFWGIYAENDRSRWYFQCLLHCGHHCFDCCCCYWTDCYCCGYSTTMNQIYRTKMRQDNFYIYLYHIFISCVHNRSALRFGEKAVFFRSLFLLLMFLSIAQLIHIYFAPFVRVSLNLGYGGTHRRKNQLFISMKVTLTHQFQLKW